MEQVQALPAQVSPAQEIPGSAAVAVIPQVSQLSAAAITNALLANRALTQKSGEKVQELLDRLPKIGPDTNLLEMDKLDADFADAQSKLTSCTTIMENRRKPLTRVFDEIRDLFTTEEALIISFKDQITTPRRNWQLEKSRRAKAEKDIADRKLIKNAEAIDIQARARTLYQQNLVKLISENVRNVNEAYNKHTIESLQGYGEKLQAWTPGLTTESDRFCKQGSTGQWFYHDEGEIKQIVDKEFSVEFNQAAIRYRTEMEAEKNRLITLIPSRIAELVRARDNETDRIAMEARLLTEKTALEQNTQQQLTNIESSAQVTAEAQKSTAVLESINTAGPAITVAKGTSVKKKYAPTTMAEHHKILVYYTEKYMGKLSQEELIKKFSFMRTACDKDLNDGTIIPGIKVVEDVTVRGRRKEEGE